MALSVVVSSSLSSLWCLFFLFVLALVLAFALALLSPSSSAISSAVTTVSAAAVATVSAAAKTISDASGRHGQGGSSLQRIVWICASTRTGLERGNNNTIVCCDDRSIETNDGRLTRTLLERCSILRLCYRTTEKKVPPDSKDPE